jgi:flavin reductase (DIM6/NTAB) family NADH-FMN oxidoreductase RutF
MEVVTMKKSLGSRTFAVPTPVWVVGTYDADGKPNVMTAAWGGICCSKPPCVYVSLREATYTYKNIKARGAYTVSIPSEDYVVQADYFGMVSGRDTDKLADTGLTSVKADHVDAPYVGEFPVVLECKLVQTVELGLHTQFVGEILDVKADESVLNEKGLPDIQLVRPFVFTPEVRAYNTIGQVKDMAFSAGKAIKG